MLKVKCYLWSGSGYLLDNVILEIEEYERDNFEVILGRAIKSGIGYSLDYNESINLQNEYGEIEGFAYIDNSMDYSELGGFIGYILIDNMRLEYI